MCASAEDYLGKRKTIENGLRVATSKHESILQRLGQQHTNTKLWFQEASKEADLNIQLWEEDFSKFGNVAVNPGFGKFFGAGNAPRRRSFGKEDAEGTSLASFVDKVAIKKSAAESKAALSTCGNELAELGSTLEQITTDYEHLMRDLGNSQTRSLRDDPEEPGRQLQEVQAIANKIASDCEHVLGLKSDLKTVTSASKIALLHTKNFLPNLRVCAIETDELLRHTIEQKNSMTQRALEHLQTIARVETAVPNLRKALDSLEISESGLAALDRVSSASNLPMTYGSLLLEAVKRREWVDKMKHDSAALAEEVAGYQEEEQKRRRKWFRGVANVVTETAEGKVLGVEINLQGDDTSWPQVTREDFQDYITSLQTIPGLEPVVESLTQTLRNLDQPTKQQVKRAKAFKMGSVHEAAGFGRGSLMLRGDDEAKVLREANLKLEEDAKGYKTRIRKLEDLLHRQSMYNRLSVGNASQSSPFGDQPTTPIDNDRATQMLPSPRQGEVSRRSSTSSRRVSFTNQGQDEKSLARRIVQLEADIMASKDTKARMEKAHHIALEEANSTKKDLLENMEAQQGEFAVERRSLEEELERLRIKIDEMEDEFDRLVGSRDNEKTGTEAKLQVLINEREEARKEAAEKVKQIGLRSRSLERHLREKSEKDVERMDLLKGMYAILDPESAAPEDSTQLVSALEELVQRCNNQAGEMAQAVALARSENADMQAALVKQKAEAAQLQTELDTKESEMLKTQEELRTEQNNVISITAELDGERKHITELREKFVEGKTGSESLQKRLEEEQAKFSALSSKLAETRSHVNSLDVELSSIQSKHRHLQDLYEAAGQRLHGKSQRAKIVSQRLYAHNDKLHRLLQSLGFIVDFQDGNMTLQRASRATGASTVFSEGSITIPVQRSVSASSTTRLLDDLSDLSPLLWMEKDLAKDEEGKFQEYLDKITRFNLDVFSEAVTKRMRDMEHTARKWQREARNYRDKAHRVQSEAHEKIAFRGFKEGDLALFLPTRNQAMKPWAAFNIGAPHYFLRENDNHKLVNRDWLVARISKVEERIVDLSKTLNSATADDGRSMTEASENGQSFEDDNPFDLSDGLRWYLLEAQEEKVGAPSTPGLGKAVVSTSTVSATRDDKATAIRVAKKKPSDAVEEASKALSRSLDSRRSSHSSKKSLLVPAGLGITRAGSNEALSPESAEPQPHKNGPGPSHLRTTSDASSLRPNDEATANAALQEEVRKDLMLGP